MIKNLIFIIAIFVSSNAFSAHQRVIAIGGANTEIIYQLQAKDLLIGSDTTSYYPKAAQLLPKVGYHRALSAEGILALNPDLVILTNEAGPKSVIRQLEIANIKMLKVKSARNIDDVIANITKIANKLDRQQEAEKLIAKIKQQQKLLTKSKTNKPKILIVHDHGSGSASAAGKNSAADAIIKLSGAVNVINEFENYKVISPEIIIAKNPDIIIVAKTMLDQISDQEQLKNNVAFEQSLAFKNKQIYVFDALEILGFGPRTVETAIKLNKLYQLL